MIILLGASQAFSFDGDRKGFVLGVGAGVSPWSHISYSGEPAEFEENAIGFGLSLLIGLGLTENDLLVLTADMSSFSSDLYGDSSVQGFKGIAWSHYFGDPGRSFFMSLGYGKYEYDWQGSRIYICWGDDCDPPPSTPSGEVPGYLAGVGYEFSKHWQVGTFVSGGLPQEESNFSFMHVNVLIQYTWF